MISLAEFGVSVLAGVAAAATIQIPGFALLRFLGTGTQVALFHNLKPLCRIQEKKACAVA